MSPLKYLMMTSEIVTVTQDYDPKEAQRLLQQHRIEKLVVIDDDGNCAGMITVRDIQRTRDHPVSCKDDQGRLRVRGGYRYRGRRTN